MRRLLSRRFPAIPGALVGFFFLALLAPALPRAPEEPEPPLPWAALETLPADLARVRDAAGRGSRDEVRRALEAVADDPSASGRSRAAASLRLGANALRRGRWTEAVRRLTAPDFRESAIAADALHLLGGSLPRARSEAIPALERVLDEFPDYLRTDEVRLELGRRRSAAGHHEAALVHFDAVAGAAASGLRGDALFETATTLERLGRFEEAARRFETLYYEMPTHRQSLPAGQTLSRLYRRPEVVAPTPAERYPKAMRRANGFARAGNHRRAHENYLEVARRFASAADGELVRLRIGVAEFHRGRLSASLRTLARVRRPDLLPEALYYRGESLRRLGRRTTQSQVLEELLALETEHPFAHLALNSLARARLAVNDREAALPYLARIAESHPVGPHGLFARWHVLWDRYRNGELEGTAAAFEQVAREHPGDFMAGQFLYFAGRTLELTGDPEAAARRYREVFLGYRNSFYGREAAERLREIAGPETIENPLTAPELLLDRFRIRRTKEAARIRELHAARFAERALAATRRAAGQGAPDDGAFHAMRGYLLSGRNSTVPAIQALRRSAPFFTSVAGEALPDAWWRLVFPLRYEDRIEELSERRDLDPFLVAALIRQESAFVARTRSPVGARGLMQVMPATGQALARLEGVPYRLARLYDPETNIRFGTRYLRQLLDEFGERPELALAGYNAGPHRVRTWTGRDLTIPRERFIEEIPFTETRNYVKLVMRNEALYRRLYPGLGQDTGPE